jgi:hypothetical protein
VAFTGTALLANDSDPQGHAVYVSFVAASSSGGGTIASHGGDAYTYTPAAGFTGTDTFIYSIADDFGGTATTTVSVEVTAPAPVPTSCTAAPALPTGLVASVSGRTVTLNWTAPAGPAWDAPTSYRFEAGLTPTSTLQTLDTGGAATTFVQVSQVDGTFYARVRGVNACGTGAASNTVPVVVGAAAPATVAVPAVAGLTQQAAQAAIAGAGLAVGAVSQANSGTVPAGLVISSSPAAGASVSPGSAVALVVSTGPTLVPVPNVVGLTQAAATTAISAAGYVVGGITQANSATVPAGSVISSNPAAGATIAAGSPVALVVSLGPAAPQGCTAAPLAPSGLAASVSGRTLTLNWAAPSGPAANAPTSYLFEAGLTATSTLQTLGTGSAATSFTQVSQVGGTFYVRVRGRNACGTGPVSNTVQVTLQ